MHELLNPNYLHELAGVIVAITGVVAAVTVWRNGGIERGPIQLPQ